MVIKKERRKWSDKTFGADRRNSFYLTVLVLNKNPTGPNPKSTLLYPIYIKSKHLDTDKYGIYNANYT